MKILHVTKKYPNALGGDAVAVSNLEKQQLDHGHEVVVLTSNCDEIIADERHYKFGLRDTPAALDNITPRRLVSLGMLIFKAFSVIRKERPDVVHTHSIDMAFVTSFATRWFKTPMVHTFHILTFPDSHHGMLRRKSELLFLRGARPQVVTAPNETDVNHLKQAGVRNARLLTNGIDRSFWKKRKQSHEVFTFITAARLEEQKGIEYLIRAVAKLKKTKQPFQLIIVGEGSLKEALQALSKKLKVDEIVEFAGHKTPEEVRSLYAMSDAVIIPSLWESGPLTAFEAWAMKLPLVITNVGMFADTSADDGRAVIVETGDYKALAKPMEELLTDATRRRDLIEAGYKAVQEHTWTAMAATASDLYAEARGMVKVEQDLSTKTMLFSKRALVAVTALASVALLAIASRISPTINTFATLPLAVFTPGLLLLLLNWPQQAKKPALMVSLATGLGLLFVAVEGQLVNWLFPIVGIHQPLQTKYLTPLQIILTVGLLGLYLRKSRGRAQSQEPLEAVLNARKVLINCLPLLLPLLAAVGAFRQNNGAGNLFTIMAFVVSAAMAAWFMWQPRLFNANWLIFNIALGLLFATSLRSWYISGFDISQEYQVFTLALKNHYWNLHALPGNDYNACLSLTTLPVALQQFTHVGAAVIYRFFYQVVFALTGVLTYLTARRFVHSRLAFLAALLYVAQTQFIDTMPQIVRQEIGFLFFGLLVYYLMDKVKLTERRKMMFLTLGAGLVLMHYSTTYVTIMIFAVAGLALWLSKHLSKRVTRLPKFESPVSVRTLLKLAVVLIIFSTLWYAEINHDSSGVITSIRDALHPHLPKLTLGGSKAQLLLGNNPDNNSAKTVAQYASSAHLTSKVTAIGVPSLPVANQFAACMATAVRDVLTAGIKVLLPLSPFILLCFKRIRKEATALGFVGIGAVVVFIAVIFLPGLSVGYNLQRLYQQCLIVLGVAGFWVVWHMLRAKTSTKTILLTAATLLYFLLAPGSAVLNQGIGGIAPRMMFNSYGEEYDQYYVQSGEVLGAEWLANNCKDEHVFADDYATLRLTAYGGLPFNSIQNNILTNNKGCLYLDYANTHNNLYYATYDKQTVRYTTAPSSFAKYDLIYDNGQSKVYRY